MVLQLKTEQESHSKVCDAKFHPIATMDPWPEFGCYFEHHMVNFC